MTMILNESADGATEVSLPPPHERMAMKVMIRKILHKNTGELLPKDIKPESDYHFYLFYFGLKPPIRTQPFTVPGIQE